MTFYRATVKDLDPLKVLLRGDSDVSTNYLDVWETHVAAEQLAVDDAVSVEIQNHMVFLQGRFGGVEGGGAGHEDVIEEDVTAIGDVAYIAGLRAITITWDPPAGGVGHGYYQVQVTLQADSTYAATLRDFSTTDTAVMVVDLTGEVEHRFRVRPIGGDGIAGAWVEVEHVEPRDIISTDITEGAVNRAAIEQFAIDSLRLDDDAVSYRTIVVGSFDNLILDPGFRTGIQRDPNPVNAGGAWTPVASNPRSGDHSLEYDATGQVAQALYRPLGDYVTHLDNIACAQGDVFYFESWSKAIAVTTYRTWAVGIEFRDPDGLLLDSTYQDYAGSSAYARGSIVATAPAGVAYVLPVLRVNNDGDTIFHYFDDLYMRKRIDGNLIVDGSITATHIAANSINASHIQAGAIEASEIAAGAISAIHIQAGTITSNEIAANTITAGDIAAGTITGDKIVAGVSLSAPAITGGTITGGTITGETITGSTISGTTITGGTIRSAPSGNRVEISDANVDRINFYLSSGVLGASIWMASASGAFVLDADYEDITLLPKASGGYVRIGAVGGSNALYVYGPIYSNGVLATLVGHTHLGATGGAVGSTGLGSSSTGLPSPDSITGTPTTSSQQKISGTFPADAGPYVEASTAAWSSGTTVSNHFHNHTHNMSHDHGTNSHTHNFSHDHTVDSHIHTLNSHTHTISAGAYST